MKLGNATKYLGYAEIAVGVIFLSVGSLALIETVLYPDSNRFGMVTAIGVFGASLGGLLAFAGVTCVAGFRFKVLAHLPLTVYGAILVVVFRPW